MPTTEPAAEAVQLAEVRARYGLGMAITVTLGVMALAAIAGVLQLESEETIAAFGVLGAPSSAMSTSEARRRRASRAPSQISRSSQDGRVGAVRANICGMEGSDLPVLVYGLTTDDCRQGSTTRGDVALTATPNKPHLLEEITMRPHLADVLHLLAVSAGGRRAALRRSLSSPATWYLGYPLEIPAGVRVTVHARTAELVGKKGLVVTALASPWNAR